MCGHRRIKRTEDATHGAEWLVRVVEMIGNSSVLEYEPPLRGGDDAHQGRTFPDMASLPSGNGSARRVRQDDRTAPTLLLLKY